MEYGFRKRFKNYEDEFFVEGAELVELYYSSGWKDVDKVVVKPLVIERTTPKKFTYRVNYSEATVSGGHGFKEEVGLIKSNNLIVAKEDTDKALDFMIKAYLEEYGKRLVKLQQTIEGINNCVVKRFGETE